MRNQKSRTPKPEIPLKNKKSRTLNVEMICPSTGLGRPTDSKEFQGMSASSLFSKLN